MAHVNTDGLLHSSEILTSENRLRWLMNRVSDGYIALDHDLNYIYANQKIGEIIGMVPASLVGRHIWEVFPDPIGTDTYHAIQQSHDTKTYVCNTDYYEPLDLWQENHKEAFNRFVVLQFSDNGKGFDAEAQRDKVFKLYQRFHDEREGKGLGLFLIKSQLETLGGSRVNEGATFTIKFKPGTHEK